MATVQFFFESSASGGYVPVLGDSTLVSGPLVSQNAGSTNYGIYYQIGGAGLNRVFDNALGPQVPQVNAELKKAYDAKFGAGRWAKDSANVPWPLPLTSLLVPVQPSSHVGSDVVGMMYSVGPQLTFSGLTPPAEQKTYTRVYADAMAQIAAHKTAIAGFRITMLSSNIYRGGAPLAPFAEAAARCIIDAVTPAVKAQPSKLGSLSILINTDHNGGYPKELKGFTAAATALGVNVTSKGFSVPVA